MADDKRKLPGAGEVFKYLSFLPMPLRILAVFVVVFLGVFLTLFQGVSRLPNNPVANAPVKGELLFVSWNVANFFDDVDDPGNNDDDEDFYAKNPDAFQKKLSVLADGLLQMNDGNGPDIVCMVEVENERCMSQLQDVVNAKLTRDGKADKKYTQMIFRLDNTGRRFAPGVLSRVKCDNNRTTKLGGRSNGRLLRTHLDMDGYDLIVIATHWTSRVSDKTGDRRMSYAKDTYGEFKEILTANPDADVIICGDLNDEFKDESIQLGLHATNDPQAVIDAVPPGREPMVLDLCSLLDPTKGTICYGSKKQVFDHICVSRGMLDGSGWSCDPKTIAIFSNDEFAMRDGCPRRFDPRTGLGYSDHFPVMVKLRIHEKQ